MDSSPGKSQETHATSEKLGVNGLPAWITEDLISRTLKVWGPRYGWKLTREDAIAMLLNVGRLFGALSRT